MRAVLVGHHHIRRNLRNVRVLTCCDGDGTRGGVGRKREVTDDQVSDAHYGAVRPVVWLHGHAFPGKESCGGVAHGGHGCLFHLGFDEGEVGLKVRARPVGEARGYRHGHGGAGPGALRRGQVDFAGVAVDLHLPAGRGRLVDLKRGAFGEVADRFGCGDFRGGGARGGVFHGEGFGVPLAVFGDGEGRPSDADEVVRGGDLDWDLEGPGCCQWALWLDDDNPAGLVNIDINKAEDARVEIGSCLEGGAFGQGVRQRGGGLLAAAHCLVVPLRREGVVVDVVEEVLDRRTGAKRLAGLLGVGVDICTHVAERAVGVHHLHAGCALGAWLDRIELRDRQIAVGGCGDLEMVGSGDFESGAFGEVTLQLRYGEHRIGAVFDGERWVVRQGILLCHLADGVDDVDHDGETACAHAVAAGDHELGALVRDHVFGDVHGDHAGAWVGAEPVAQVVVGTLEAHVAGDGALRGDLHGTAGRNLLDRPRESGQEGLRGGGGCGGVGQGNTAAQQRGGGGDRNCGATELHGCLQ